MGDAFCMHDSRVVNAILIAALTRSILKARAGLARTSCFLSKVLLMAEGSGKGLMLSRKSLSHENIDQEGILSRYSEEENSG